MIEHANLVCQPGNLVRGNSINGVKEIQQELFDRVVHVLADNNIIAEGEGAISLDINEQDEVVVIGNIRNKDKISTLLNSDNKIKEILSAGLGNSSKSTIVNQRQEDCVEVSGAAKEAYIQNKNKQVSSDEYPKRMVDGDEDSVNSKPRIHLNDNPKQLGVVAESKAEDKAVVSESITKKTTLIDSQNLNDLRKVLGLENSSSDAEGILSALSDRIVKSRNEINNLIKGILEEKNIVISEDEDFDITFGEDGLIVVAATKDGKLAETRAELIQETLNAESEVGLELKAKLKSVTLDEMALAELSEKDDRKEFEISDGLAVAFIEEQFGTSLNSLRGEDGKLDEQLDEVKELIEESPNLVAALNSSTDYKSIGISGSFILDGLGIKSDKSEDYVESMKKHVEDNLFYNAILYNDPKAYSKTDLYEIYPPLDKYLGVKYEDQEKVKNVFEVPAELRVEYFEARISDDGEIEIDVAKNGLDEELSSIMKDVARTFFKGELSDHNEYIKTFMQTLLEEHEAEDGDTLEFEHEVKITFDYQKGAEFEIISPEADAQAAKELKTVTANVSEGINEYLQEEENITTPVEVKINEDGKLVASPETLTIVEAQKVEGVLDLINNSVARLNDPEAIKEMEEKILQENQKNDSAESNEKVEEEGEIKSSIVDSKDKFAKVIKNIIPSETEVDSKDSEEQADIKKKLEIYESATKSGIKKRFGSYWYYYW